MGTRNTCGKGTQTRRKQPNNDVDMETDKMKARRTEVLRMRESIEVELADLDNRIKVAESGEGGSEFAGVVQRLRDKGILPSGR